MRDFLIRFCVNLSEYHVYLRTKMIFQKFLGDSVEKQIIFIQFYTFFFEVVREFIIIKLKETQRVGEKSKEKLFRFRADSIELLFIVAFCLSFALSLFPVSPMIHDNVVTAFHSCCLLC